MASQTIPDIERALRAVGELLAAERVSAGIVIVGGAALNLIGVVHRATRDVDVLALAQPRRGVGAPELARPDPLPTPLAEAAAKVARDLRLPADWLNTVVAGQWDTGLPPGLADRVSWRRYGGLSVGIADRRDLIFLKLYAAADQTGPSSVHFQDLLALRPTVDELEAAAGWVRTQDASPELAAAVDAVLHHVRRSGR